MPITYLDSPQQETTTIKPKITYLDMPKEAIPKEEIAQDTVQPLTTEKSVGGIFGKVPESQYQSGERNILGNIFERPAAMSREAIRENPLTAFLGPLAGLTAKKGSQAQQAAINPNISPTFQQESIDKFTPPAGFIPTTGKGVGGTAALGANTLLNSIVGTPGAIADFATNPAQAILTLLGVKAPETKVGQALGSIGKTNIEDIPRNVVNTIKNIPKQVGTKFNEVTGRGIEPLKSVLDKTQENFGSDIEKLGMNIDKEKNIQDILKENTKTKLDNLKVNKQVALEQAEREAKDKLPDFKKSLSTWYGKHYDAIIDNAVKSEKVKMTTADAQVIVDKIRGDLDAQGITSGKGYKQFETFEKKYGAGGINEEVNPEAAQMAKAMGYKNIKGLKGAGIDWSKVNLEQSGGGITLPTDKINLGDFVRDAKQVTGDFSEGSRVGSLAHRYISEWMGKNLPTMGKLNELAGPILEAKNFATDVIKPNDVYKGKFAELIDKAISSPQNVSLPEKDLLDILEKGKYGIKGIGPVSKNARVVQNTIDELQKSTSQSMEESIAKKSELAQSLHNTRLASHATKSDLSNILSEANRKKMVISPKQLIQYLQKKAAYRVGFGGGK